MILKPLVVRLNQPIQDHLQILRHVWTPHETQEKSSEQCSAWSGLTCVRPLMRLTCRGPGWEFADQVQFRPTRSKRLSQSWFS